MVLHLLQNAQHYADTAPVELVAVLANDECRLGCSTVAPALQQTKYRLCSCPFTPQMLRAARRVVAPVWAWLLSRNSHAPTAGQSTCVPDRAVVCRPGLPFLHKSTGWRPERSVQEGRSAVHGLDFQASGTT